MGSFLSVPAVAAKPAFRKSDSLYGTLERLEFKRGELEPLADLGSEALTAFGVGVAVGLAVVLPVFFPAVVPVVFPGAAVFFAAVI